MAPVKLFLDAFILISIGITFGQDLFTLMKSPNSVSTDPSKPNQSQNVPINDVSHLPPVQGVVVMVTDGFKKQLTQLLAKQNYNVQTESYQFEGPQWWYDKIMTYGHMVLVYLLMSKYKTQTNEGSKKKIMYIGGLIVVAWMFLSPMLRKQQLAIKVNGVKVYTKDQIIPNQIIPIIADGAQGIQIKGFNNIPEPIIQDTIHQESFDYDF